MFSKIREYLGALFGTPYPTITLREPLTDEERVTKWVMKNRCPDCGASGFIEGSSGGMSQNINCANPDCGSKFNFMGPIGVERIGEPSPAADSAHAKARNLENRPS